MLSSQHYLPPLYHVLEKFALAEQLFSLLVMEHPTVSFAIKTMLHAYNTLQTFHNTADPTKRKKTISRNFSLENYPAILEMARMYLPHLICKSLVLGLPGVP